MTVLANTAAGTTTPSLSAEDIEKFLEAIEGKWTGQAVISPVGPLTYDIDFTRTEDSAIEGAANPGAAIHYWTFYREQQAITLRFLSTFRGNTDPLHLSATAQAEGAMVFQAFRPAYLQVHVRPQLDNIMIKVLLHGELHVVIYLKKTAKMTKCLAGDR